MLPRCLCVIYAAPALYLRCLMFILYVLVAEDAVLQMGSAKDVPRAHAARKDVVARMRDVIEGSR